ncbi:MAG: cysteine--tRNA ligase, partial [Nitrospinaceae bacterium]|nr:cysteine--tRNA ligase [Nitrospinaceae bacterium]NIR54481.1 cysteine--tRNA ligase [Nitrospinaceae bacterium]NIS84900.1 cysteine--tRNA ligase [Nitrospinaceae bacterium]NIT81712.1 cysteine--tRNA ligase [Nitrospinaceae bacterium]NIU43983.1 cysteine--tRNA ligase [Nitrospinaceae bacterium]
LDVDQIERLIAERAAARKARNWTKADQVREQLTRLGIILEDTPHGTEWKIK